MLGEDLAWFLLDGVRGRSSSLNFSWALGRISGQLKWGPNNTFEGRTPFGGKAGGILTQLCERDEEVGEEIYS